jgi:Zn-finger nucleic acid-binding protein
MVACPRCRHTLATLSTAEGTADECDRCGGLFVGSPMLHALIEARRPTRNGPTDDGWPPLPPRASSTFPPPPLASVVYIPCPLCRKAMNRRSFGRRSAIIVDTCKLHGTWFDTTKLTAALAFVERGGLEIMPSSAQLRAPDAEAPSSRRSKG